VADRESKRIRHLIYLDAYVPEDGESWQQLASTHRDSFEAMINGDTLVPPWVATDQAPPKDVPHPLLAFTEVIRIETEAALEIPTSYILTIEDQQHPERDEFAQFADRARKRNWPVYKLPADHNPQWSAVTPLVELFAEIAGK